MSKILQDGKNQQFWPVGIIVNEKLTFVRIVDLLMQFSIQLQKRVKYGAGIATYCGRQP